MMNFLRRLFKKKVQHPCSTYRGPSVFPYPDTVFAGHSLMHFHKWLTTNYGWQASTQEKLNNEIDRPKGATLFTQKRGTYFYYKYWEWVTLN